jgi:small subunit ribosomal protein S16
VAVKIKLKRLGKIREPYYRIVVADARTKRDGRAIEEIGKYHPKAEPSLIEVNSERVQHWLSVGAQPTDPVRVLLTITGDWQKFTGQSGTEGTLRKAEPRADKKERFASAASQSQASKDDKGAGKAAAQARATRPAKDAPAKDAPAKDAPAKDAPAKEGAAKDAPARSGRARATAAAAKPAAEAAADGAQTAAEKVETVSADAAGAQDSAAVEAAAAAEADDGEPGSGA